MDQKAFLLSLKALIANADQHILVLRRSWQSKNNAGLWDLPGGKCDPGESMDAALRREVAEETGLTVRLDKIVGSCQVELADRVVAYLLVDAQTDRTEVRLSAEHEEYRWAPRAQLAQLAFPEQFRPFLAEYAAAGKMQAKRPFDKDWYRDIIQAYPEAQSKNSLMAKALESTLKQAVSRLGMHAIVQARPKTLASFAEKIFRKNYVDPLKQMTDLCGARVITHTLKEVADVCKFVEENFHIYWEDSGDKLESLAASEFGYLSRHYIVSFKAGVLPEDMVPAALFNPPMKAELQVRTILQHAWADIYHELSYKNRFRLPRRWEREFARLAAILEEADREFDAIRIGLGEYAASYGAYYTKERLQEEIDKLVLVLEAEPSNVDIAHQLAKMAIALEDWRRAVEVLTPFAEAGPPSLLRDLGMSMCKLHGKAPHDSDFQKGQACLESATQRDPNDVDAWASLAGTWRKRANSARSDEERADFHKRAHQFYRQGYEKDPGHPYPLGNYIEYELATRPDLDIGGFFRQSLETATQRCRGQAEVGVNLPWVYFDLGKFQLLLREPYAALGHYAAGVAHSPAAFFLDSALASFDTLAAAQASLPGFDWSRTFLRLAREIRFGKPAASAEAAPVVILAGYCDRPPDPEHRKLLLHAFKEFKGTLISGGTSSGISALAGELQTASPDTIRTLGYVPRDIPSDCALDTRYSELRHTAGAAFTPAEPLQYWTDLHRAGTPIEKVMLLAIDGGALTLSECQMALALGVPVGFIEARDSEAGKRLAERPWSAHVLLQRLSPDAGVVRKFLATVLA